MPAEELLFQNPNAEDGSALPIDCEIIGDVFHVELTASPVAFPPADRAPGGGLFVVKFPSPWLLRKTAEGPNFEREAGEHRVFAPKAEHFFYASQSGAQTVEVIRYLQVGEL